MDKLSPTEQTFSDSDKIYRRSDFTEEAVTTMQKNFDDGMIASYLKAKKLIDASVPIIRADL